MLWKHSENMFAITGSFLLSSYLQPERNRLQCAKNTENNIIKLRETGFFSSVSAPWIFYKVYGHHWFLILPLRLECSCILINWAEWADLINPQTIYMRQCMAHIVYLHGMYEKHPTGLVYHVKREHTIKNIIGRFSLMTWKGICWHLVTCA